MPRTCGGRYSSDVEGRPARQPDAEEARDAVWSAVHEALPARWHVGPVTYDHSRQVWSLTAHGPLPGRGKAPEIVTGTGTYEVASLRDLDDRLPGVPKPDGGRMEELRRRCRQAFLEGAEEDSRRRLGRGLTAEELERVLRRYPGDVGERRAP